MPNYVVSSSYAGSQHVADVATADTQKKARNRQANEYIKSKQWPSKAAIGRLTDKETAKYNVWLDYLDELGFVDISSTPGVSWPENPSMS